MMMNFERIDRPILLDGRENITLNENQIDYFLLETDENYRNKEDRAEIKKFILDNCEKISSQDNNIKFSFSKDYTIDESQHKIRNKWKWGGWNSFSLESYLKNAADDYFFIVGENKDNQEKEYLLHIIHFTHENLEKHLYKKELAANGVYYFYFCQERDFDLDKINNGDFDSLSGTWINGEGEKLEISTNGEILNRNFKLFLPHREEKSSLPFVHVRGNFTGGFAMGILKINETIPNFDNHSNELRPRLVLGQTMKEYREAEYFYRN